MQSRPKLLAFLGIIAAACFEQGVQVSGLANPVLASAAWTVGAACAAYIVWQTAREWRAGLILKNLPLDRLGIGPGARAGLRWLDVPAIAAFLTFAFCFVLIGLYYHSMTAVDTRALDAQKREQYARSWIKLSQEIFAELQAEMASEELPPDMHKVPEANKHDVWAAYVDRSTHQYLLSEGRLISLFSARLSEAKAQLDELNIMPDEITNSLLSKPAAGSMRARHAVDFLGAKGLQILRELEKQ